MYPFEKHIFSQALTAKPDESTQTVWPSLKLIKGDIRVDRMCLMSRAREAREGKPRKIGMRRLVL